jgi:hypothetical protein
MQCGRSKQPVEAQRVGASDRKVRNGSMSERRSDQALLRVCCGRNSQTARSRKDFARIYVHPPLLLLTISPTPQAFLPLISRTRRTQHCTTKREAHFANIMETLQPDMTPKKTVAKDIFKPYAPPYNLPFPDSAQLTAYELLAFLPNSLRSPDVIYRFVSNGASRRALWALINSARDLEKEWTANRCGSTITKVMNQAGFLGWTTKIHEHWHAPRKSSWDETHLGVAGFTTPGDSNEGDEPSIQFKNLANSIRRWPQGEEGLDLTRIVEYCVYHPAEAWTYPQDYNKLLGLMGGPRAVSKGNLDRVLFTAWEETKPPPPRPWSTAEHETSKALLETRKANKKGHKMRRTTPMSNAQSRDVTPAPGVHHKERGRPMKREEEVEDMNIEVEQKYEDVEEPYIEHYTRAAAKYVAPPQEATMPDQHTLGLVFAAEIDVSETNPFSAYAFGGPRQQPPYRMLHDIDQPHEGDVSGWAENLRWAFEQRACFWNTMPTTGWSESPEHMEFIADTRREQVWASDELSEQLRQDEEDEMWW